MTVAIDSIFCLVTLTAILFGCATILAEEPIGPRDSAGNAAAVDSPLRIDLQWDDKADGLVLLMSVKNTGGNPLVLDRELVLGFGVHALGPDRRMVTMKGIADTSSDGLSADALKDRITVLKPGDRLSRRIDLTGGFRVFTVARAEDFDRNQYLISAFETDYRLPAHSKAERVLVECDASSIADGFRPYTGVSADSVGLFEGRAKSEIPLPRGD